jgi:hypothetical protein
MVNAFKWYYDSETGHKMELSYNNVVKKLQKLSTQKTAQ